MMALLLKLKLLISNDIFWDSLNTFKALICDKEDDMCSDYLPELYTT